MNRFLVCASFLFLVSSLLVAQNLMHYTSSKYEYSILLPEEWMRNDEIKNPNISLVLISPDGASVSVSFYDLKGVSSKQFVDEYFNSMSKQMKDASLEEKGMFKTKEGKADYMLMDYQNEDHIVREKVCFYIREKEIAVVSASSAKSAFQNHAVLFDQILKSFIFSTIQEMVEEQD